LAYLHRLNIAHLDIKPQNLIINDYLEIKIIDFSVSMDYSRNAKEIKIPYVGTPFFMAPEIIKSEKVKRKDMQKIEVKKTDCVGLSLNVDSTRFSMIDYKSFEKEKYRLKRTSVSCG
jgi:serine/threonine protein kinase